MNRPVDEYLVPPIERTSRNPSLPENKTSITTIDILSVDTTTFKLNEQYSVKTIRRRILIDRIRCYKTKENGMPSFHVTLSHVKYWLTPLRYILDKLIESPFNKPLEYSSPHLSLRSWQHLQD